MSPLKVNRDAERSSLSGSWNGGEKELLLVGNNRALGEGFEGAAAEDEMAGGPQRQAWEAVTVFCMDQLMKELKEERVELTRRQVENPVQYATPERGGTCNGAAVQDATWNYITTELARSELKT